MTITAIQPFYRAGVLIAAGPTQLSYSAADEGDLVRRGVAAYVGSNPQTGGPVVVQVGGMASGAWAKVPSIFRLRLAGTGTVTIDARDSLGNITSAVAAYTVSGATDQIEFPYAGDNAVAIRATLTGTATAEVI